jgi:hypothetical protein
MLSTLAIASLVVRTPLATAFTVALRWLLRNSTCDFAQCSSRMRTASVETAGSSDDLLVWCASSGLRNAALAPVCRRSCRYRLAQHFPQRRAGQRLQATSHDGHAKQKQTHSTENRDSCRHAAFSQFAATIKPEVQCIRTLYLIIMFVSALWASLCCGGLRPGK